MPERYIERNSVNIIQVEDVLFNNTNSQELVGKTAYFDLDETYFYSNHITVIRVNKDIILPKYLWILLNLYQKRKIFFNICTNWNNQSGVGIERLLSLKIPIPNLEIQEGIVTVFENANYIKQANEAEAKKLLANIDAYLLEQLGIVLPDKIEEKNVFYVPFSKVQGNRFDPKPYLSSNEALYKSLFFSKFQCVPLKNILIQSVAGDWGIENRINGYEERLVIRATEFDNIYNLNLENSRVKYRFINEVKLDKMDLQVGDLLIEKSGGSENQPVGRIALITKDIANQYKLAYSNFIHKIRVSDQINSEYLFYFLKTIHNIKITDLMQSQTNGIRNLIMREYFNIPVSLPPLKIQTEITNHIRNTIERAKTLETEAKEVIDKAKAEIEKMILR